MWYLAFACDRPAIRMMRRTAHFTHAHAARIVALDNIETVRAAVFDDADDAETIAVVGMIAPRGFRLGESRSPDAGRIRARLASRSRRVLRHLHVRHIDVRRRNLPQRLEELAR